MARLSPSAQALRDLQKAIHRHSGKTLGDVARRAVREHVGDPDASDRELTLWLWGYVYGEAPPEVFAHPVDDEHTCISTAALYTLRSAPETIVRAPFTAAERRALRRARAAVAEAGAISELTEHRWRHLVALQGSPLDLTFFAAAPEAGGAALCWEPGLERTAVYPHDGLEIRRAVFGPVGVITAPLHEEVHLALSLRSRTRMVKLTVLRGAAMELAPDTAQAFAYALAESPRATPTADDLTDHLRQMGSSAADVLLRLSRQASATTALRAMVSISVAAQEGDDRLLAEAKRHLRGRVTLRELERLLDLS